MVSKRLKMPEAWHYVRALAARFGLQHALESVDEHNPWLERFYAGGLDAMRSAALRSIQTSIARVREGTQQLATTTDGAHRINLNFGRALLGLSNAPAAVNPLTKAASLLV